MKYVSHMIIKPFSYKIYSKKKIEIQNLFY